MSIYPYQNIKPEQFCDILTTWLAEANDQLLTAQHYLHDEGKRLNVEQIEELLGAVDEPHNGISEMKKMLQKLEKEKQAAEAA
jgi:hypothetical protein